MKLLKKKSSAENSHAVGLYVPSESAPAGDLFRLFTAPCERVSHKWLHYFEVYERYFSAYRHRPVNILEIGVYRGGTLELWKKYFGRQARIFGVDVNPDCKRFEDEQTSIFIGDQEDRGFLCALMQQLPMIDIVIDDGGHRSSQQIASFEEIYPHMAERGVYVVEDTHTNYWRRYNTGSRLSFVNYAKARADELSAWHFDKESHKRYAIPPSLRKGEINVSEFTRQTKSVHFYNGMVVFERAPTAEPYHCYSNVVKKKG